jgi:hypothetical protein
VLVLGLWCLTPLSTIFQLNRGCQFYRWRKQEYQKKTTDLPQVIDKKSLKIPNGKSESVCRRRTDNTMAKSKSTKGQATIYKTYT